MRNFEGVETARLGKMRPGIIEAIEEYSPGNIFKTSNIDSNYDGKHIGSNLKALTDAGLAEEVDNDSKISKYELVSPLDEAHAMAETAFRIRIIRELDYFGEKALNPAEDIREFGIVDKADEESLVQYKNGGYHNDTIEFLRNLSIIDDDRLYISDETDREFLEHNSEDWRIIADHLADHAQMPDEQIQEVEQYNQKFGTSFTVRPNRQY